MVGNHSPLTAPRVCKGCTQLVPVSVIVGPQSTSSRQRLNGGFVIHVYILHDTKCDKNVSVEWIGCSCLTEQRGHLRTPFFVLVWCRSFQAVSQCRVLFMVLNPPSQILQGRQPVKLICKAHPQGQDTFQVVRVDRVASAQAPDCLYILVQSSIQLAKLSPSFRTLWVLLHLSFQCQQCFLVSPLRQQSLGLCKRVGRGSIWVVF
mmetsp:Transcript_66597/g.118388  ORF Transcript_66597/g.118388 Transcript_66597/m.118388 type:complete len:205 (-) Transcript_66597:253-867(-)